jgi:putative zinc finger protein
MDSPSDHIPTEQLMDLLDRRLSGAAEATVQGHLTGCPRCAHEAARLTQVMEQLRADALEDAPAEVQSRAARLLTVQAAANRPSLRRQVLAALRFDSAQRPLALGVRDGRQGARQLLYLAAGHELDLRIAPADSVWTVSGQLLGPAEEGEVLLQGPTATWHGLLNELGEFTLLSVPGGSYVLSVRVADLDIDIPDVTVGYTV